MANSGGIHQHSYRLYFNHQKTIISYTT